MNSIGIIGFGRFGKVLANILQKGFSINAYDPKSNGAFPSVTFTDLKSVLKEKVIFIAVPIRHFESVIKEISPNLSHGTTIIDVCSVKTHPVNMMEKYLPNHVGIIATHPMFGPDSFVSNNRLKMMMNNTRDSQEQFKFWQRFFTDQGIQVMEMSPDEHDQLAAKTQGVTHFLGRMLKEYGIGKTAIDTQGFRDLLDLVDQTCNDTWELYTDLQLYNPYTDETIKKLKLATNSLDDRLKELQNVAD
ncbi:MAG: prephenate dehydrogenase/arogenate dehydrogenase family protein [Candidatus Marinimicrobia bacterium]|mgnify:CR=1 FL=1|jgi:prephenate dehydrogenase|nr:prephenate dehydrogenase/arogenate dehydrogenase family protein [Candidatus Neomarinimicrobiota bacterium]MBT3675390.1 prephenate dehydrogenase/arogenate dehydrogenase family protein [Candidatus Neomarinimicrobiota bacterium]MBT3763808.1 prephenate dehydrogenase/arogenate dehydrogenase family protein [Candidatus Neomarinimicrobiota bacterium]MBT4069491.1 prephenate dehydrogenase/arogenate dehydrogenase family protein [Candidatus Neomarinimicrobiota bacterium]MBT4270930.1 prephenate dehydroge